MSKKKNRAYILVTLFFATAFFVQCANPAKPQGGPRDTIPPKVVSMLPGNFKTNFKEKKIVILFDEYIKLKDIQKEFIVSPILERKPIVTTKGRAVVIDIKSEMDSATTYRFDFGKAITDNNEGNPLKGFAYVFSTGNAIDSLVMSGQVLDGFKGDSVYNALLLFFDAKADTMTYDSTVFRSKVLSIARTDSSGLFIAENLRDMEYKIYALLDKNGNSQYEPQEDKIGFLDSSFNPAKMPDFQVWYDTTYKRLAVTPQLKFRTFEEVAIRKMNLSDSRRPLARKIEIYFTSRDPQIKQLKLEGIDTTQLIRQQNIHGDTLQFWFKQAVVPDTIKGEISFMSTDSIGKPTLITKKISIAKPFVAPVKNRDKEKDKETPLENPFKIDVKASSSLNPELDIPMSFEYPLSEIDSARIVLEKLIVPKESRGGSARAKAAAQQPTRVVRVPVHLERDTANILEWKLKARWENDQSYNLLIPSKVFTNIEGQQNDTLKSTFTTLSPDKHGVITFTIKGNDHKGNYIVSLMDAKGNILQTKPFVAQGKQKFNFIPAGDYKIRVIEDVNKDGKWNTGSLVDRLQPERIAIVTNERNQALLAAKAGWEIDLDIDVQQLFGKPFILKAKPTKESGVKLKETLPVGESLQKIGQDTLTDLPTEALKTDNAKAAGLVVTPQELVPVATDSLSAAPKPVQQMEQSNKKNKSKRSKKSKNTQPNNSSNSRQEAVQETKSTEQSAVLEPV